MDKKDFGKFLYTTLIFGSIAFAILTFFSNGSLTNDVGGSLLFGIIATLLYLLNETKRKQFKREVEFKEKTLIQQNNLLELKELRFLLNSKNLTPSAKEKISQRIEILLNSSKNE